MKVPISVRTEFHISQLLHGSAHLRNIDSNPQQHLQQLKLSSLQRWRRGSDRGVWFGEQWPDRKPLTYRCISGLSVEVR